MKINSYKSEMKALFDEIVDPVVEGELKLNEYTDIDELCTDVRSALSNVASKAKYRGIVDPDVDVRCFNVENGYYLEIGIYFLDEDDGDVVGKVVGECTIVSTFMVGLVDTTYVDMNV